jgi:hypothetical protein
MRTSKRIEEAARKFFNAIAPGIPWAYTDHKAKPLALAAFALYVKAWEPFDIRQWEWPFAEIKAHGKFAGDEPWTVLLREAVKIARQQRRAAKQLMGA